MKKSTQEIVRRTRGRGTGFEFEDGTTLTTAELLARGFDLDGTAGDDQMQWRNHEGNLRNATAANDETANAWRVAA